MTSRDGCFLLNVINLMTRVSLALLDLGLKSWLVTQQLRACCGDRHKVINHLKRINKDCLECWLQVLSRCCAIRLVGHTAHNLTTRRGGASWLLSLGWSPTSGMAKRPASYRGSKTPNPGIPRKKSKKLPPGPWPWTTLKINKNTSFQISLVFFEVFSKELGVRAWGVIFFVEEFRGSGFSMLARRFASVVEKMSRTSRCIGRLLLNCDEGKEGENLLSQTWPQSPRRPRPTRHGRLVQFFSIVYKSLWQTADYAQKKVRDTFQKVSWQLFFLVFWAQSLA